MAKIHPAKNVLKWATLALFIATGVFALVTTVAFLVIRSETSKMTPSRSGRVAGVDGLFVVEDQGVNFYLLKQGERFIAFDAGRGTRGALVALHSLGIDPGKVVAVFLTHSDSDHVGGVGFFTNAKVYLSRLEEPLAAGKISRMLFFKNAFLVPHSGLDDGQEIFFGPLRVRAISTPGHTPGSMCYAVGDEALFTGDTMSLRDGKAGVFSEFFNMSSSRQEASLHRLASLSSMKAAFTARHGNTLHFQGAIASWR
jgi:glyoxylase-like metal-dependent hydrolase (beta-lactamase superfamily II)